MKKRFHLSPDTEHQLQSISARQIDRRQRAHKQRLNQRRYGCTKPGALPKHQITIKTDGWDVRASPGGDSVQAAELQILRDRLDPFELARMIDRKLGRIYALANWRRSPKPQNLFFRSVIF